MSDWISELKTADKKTAVDAAIQAEFAVYEERRYQALIDDWWEEFQSQIENEAALLEKGITTKRTPDIPSIQMERFGSRGYLVVARLQRDARLIRVAYSYSDYGIVAKRDDIERFSLGLNANQISVAGQMEFSRYLLMRLIQESEK